MMKALQPPGTEGRRASSVTTLVAPDRERLPVAALEVVHRRRP
jgi:hypothetical protein